MALSTKKKSLEEKYTKEFNTKKAALEREYSSKIGTIETKIKEQNINIKIIRKERKDNIKEIIK